MCLKISSISLSPVKWLVTIYFLPSIIYSLCEVGAFANSSLNCFKVLFVMFPLKFFVISNIQFSYFISFRALRTSNRTMTDCILHSSAMNNSAVIFIFLFHIIIPIFKPTMGYIFFTALLYLIVNVVTSPTHKWLWLFVTVEERALPKT
jgi:hypothetical protein